jgi:PAS domain S-box-containing protein
MSLFKKKDKTSSSSKSSSSKSKTPEVVPKGNSRSLNNSESISEKKESLRTKEPSAWSVGDVANWLDTLDISDARAVFIENEISGGELLDLADVDLKNMGITKVGQRKRILQKVAELKGGVRAEKTNTSEDTSLDQDQVLIKALCGDEVRTLKTKAGVRFEELSTEIANMFSKKRFRLKYKDSDGDEVTISRDEDLAEAIKSLPSGVRTLKIFVYERREGDAGGARNESATSNNSNLSLMFSLFDTLIDAVTVINEKGIVQYVNKSAERFTGFRSREIVGRNVNILMTDEYKSYHDNYLRGYLKSGQAKVIGSGRDVVFQRKDGSIAPCRLEVTEKVVGEMRLFVGFLKEVKETVAPKSILQQEREVLDGLLVPAMVIDETGLINCFNKTAETFFGYKLVEVIGKNVSSLMPSPHKEVFTII